jgi:hypothetical protein
MKTKISVKAKIRLYKSVQKEFPELSKEQVKKICDSGIKLSKKN